MDMLGTDALPSSSLTTFEGARSGLAKLIGAAEASSAWENAKVTPDGTTVARWRARQTEWAEIGRSLCPDDTAGLRTVLTNVAEAIDQVTRE